MPTIWGEVGGGSRRASHRSFLGSNRALIGVPLGSSPTLQCLQTLVGLVSSAKERRSGLQLAKPTLPFSSCNGGRYGIPDIMASSPITPSSSLPSLVYLPGKQDTGCATQDFQGSTTRQIPGLSPWLSRCVYQASLVSSQQVSLP